MYNKYMEFKDYYNPLWEINLKKSLSNPSLFTLEDQLKTLNYLEAINSDFQKFTNLYFKHLDPTPEAEKTLKDLNDRFQALNSLITLVKSMLKSFK